MSTLSRTLVSLALAISTVGPVACIRPAAGLDESEDPWASSEPKEESKEDVTSVEEALAVDYFRVVSERKRDATGDDLCLEPLDNVAGAPVLQKKCNNNPLGPSNTQAFFKSVTQGYRMQYALKDKNSNVDLCLQAAGGTPAISKGVVATLFNCLSDRPNQVIWTSPADAAGYSALAFDHSHRCLTVMGALDADQVITYQFDMYYGAASCSLISARWQLRKDSGVYNWGQSAPEGWTPPPCVNN